MKRHYLLCSVLLLAISKGFLAQGVGASGDVKGVITDSTGAVMQNVSIAAVETQRGVRHTASTDSNGEYRLAGLSPGSYEVSAAMPGFETQVHRAVMIDVGRPLLWTSV